MHQSRQIVTIIALCAVAAMALRLIAGPARASGPQDESAYAAAKIGWPLEGRAQDVQLAASDAGGN